jgi:nicotinamidase-related amidase
MNERAAQSDAELFRQRGFGLKIGFGERPALLVIDVLKAFTNPQMMLGSNLDKEIEAIQPLIAVAHERGCTTSGCVRATAVDAVQTGLRPMVVREAVGDRSAAAHDQSLFDLNAKYADVVSLDETLHYMRTISHNSKG